jgi:hypothetical protein
MQPRKQSVKHPSGSSIFNLSLSAAKPPSPAQFERLSPRVTALRDEVLRMLDVFYR